MSYCHVSNQIADYANQPEARSFGELNEWEQEYIVSELAESVQSDKSALKWPTYPHIIDEDFAKQSMLEEATFIDELVNAVLTTSTARTLYYSQLKAETKALILHALQKTGVAPEGYDFKEILGSEAA